jgi:hypothetical protein
LNGSTANLNGAFAGEPAENRGSQAVWVTAGHHRMTKHNFSTRRNDPRNLMEC